MNSDADKIHPTEVHTKIGGRELGRQIMRMRYDVVRDVVDGMRREAYAQGNGDHMRGREKIAAEIRSLVEILYEAEKSLEKIETICKPYIDREIAGSGK